LKTKKTWEKIDAKFKETSQTSQTSLLNPKTTKIIIGKNISLENPQDVGIS